jgi:two-component system nitrate/nitrite response regulator NarL
MRVIVVSDDPLARGGLATLLEGQRGVRVAAQVGTREDWAALALAYEPDVGVWDLGTGLFGEAPVELGPGGPPILALVQDDAQAAAAQAAGARGVLSRDADGERLAAALTALVHGLVVLDPAFGDAPRPRSVTPAALVEGLTPREQEVLALLAEGVSNKQIAHRLGISERTAKFHVNAILGKLGAESRTEAVVLAARLGLIVL